MNAETIQPQFHVDNLSSAHIYVRLTPEQNWDSLPAALIEDCAQLTKANSIEGSLRAPTHLALHRFYVCERGQRADEEYTQATKKTTSQ